MVRKIKPPCSVVFAINHNLKLSFSYTTNVTPIARLVWPIMYKSEISKNLELWGPLLGHKTTLYKRATLLGSG